MVATFYFSSSVRATRGVEFRSSATPEALPMQQEHCQHHHRHEKFLYILREKNGPDSSTWSGIIRGHMCEYDQNRLYSHYTVFRMASHNRTVITLGLEPTGHRHHHGSCAPNPPFVLHDKRIGPQRVLFRMRLCKRGSKASFHPSLFFPGAFI